MADIIGNTVSYVYGNVASNDAVQLTQGNVALQQGEPNTDVQAAQNLLWPGQTNNYALPLVNGQYVSYPAPAGPTATAQQWAVGKYNLDPFVWFVHSYLQAYEYAFSVDDRYGNIEVPDATGFTISIGGPNGIPPAQQFPYGSNPS